VVEFKRRGRALTSSFGDSTFQTTIRPHCMMYYTVTASIGESNFLQNPLRPQSRGLRENKNFVTSLRVLMPRRTLMRDLFAKLLVSYHAENAEISHAQRRTEPTVTRYPRSSLWTR